MARITECPPCSVGDHDAHYKTVQAVADGCLGGAVCLCKGECRNKSDEAKAAALGLPLDLLLRIGSVL